MALFGDEQLALTPLLSVVLDGMALSMDSIGFDILCSVVLVASVARLRLLHSLQKTSETSYIPWKLPCNTVHPTQTRDPSTALPMHLHHAETSSNVCIVHSV